MKKKMIELMRLCREIYSFDFVYNKDEQKIKIRISTGVNERDRIFDAEISLEKEMKVLNNDIKDLYCGIRKEAVALKEEILEKFSDPNEVLEIKAVKALLNLPARVTNCVLSYEGHATTVILSAEGFKYLISVKGTKMSIDTEKREEHASLNIKNVELILKLL